MVRDAAKGNKCEKINSRGDRKKEKNNQARRVREGKSMGCSNPVYHSRRERGRERGGEGGGGRGVWSERKEIPGLLEVSREVP